MKNTLEFIVKSIVDYPEKVIVNEKQNEDKLILEVEVANEDMGKIIGKQGKTAKSIRSIIKAISIKKEKKVIVEILEK